MKVYRANARSAEYDRLLNRHVENIAPMERATLDRLKKEMQVAFNKAAEDVRFEAAYQEAKKKYEDFLDSVSSKTNSVRIFRVNVS